MKVTTLIDGADVVRRASQAGRFPGRRTVEVVDNRMLTQGVHLLTIRDEFVATHAQPAQFINLYSRNALCLHPRPFGIAQVQGDLVSVIFAVVGQGTAEFAQLQSGESIDILGPLGKPFDVCSNAHYLLVAGGLGVPPLMYTAQCLAQRTDVDITAVFGYRDVRFADDMIGKYTTNVHSISNVQGNVIDLLNHIESSIKSHSLPPVILSCGPMAMMKAVCQWAKPRGIPCQVSLEARMGCGYGTCVVCVTDTIDGRQKVCVDGPVFTAEQLGW